jgi:hypothetical protein
MHAFCSIVKRTAVCNFGTQAKHKASSPVHIRLTMKHLFHVLYPHALYIFLHVYRL